MRKISAAIGLLFICMLTKAQTNTFPATGNAGVGTLSPASTLQVIGTSRFGSAANYLQVDASGNMSFVGTPAYRVAGNKYAFQYSGNPNYGLFFNSTNVQYEFRNGSAVPVFLVNANSGNSVFNGTVKIGTYTLPATDGTNGQILKTNGAGILTWSADNAGSYVAGTGISISGTTITNSAPDKTIVLTGGSNISVTGTYPNFAIANTAPTGWSLGGNSATNPATQFIGTIDAKALALRVNNIRAGFIEADEIKGTTAFGQYSLVANTGKENTAIGFKSLQSNSTGAYNTAVGFRTMNSNTSGYSNTAIGDYALSANTTGYENTVGGAFALQNNTEGYHNTAIGYSALWFNLTGSDNSAFGDGALSKNDGTSNTGVGAYALNSNTSGNYNTSVGHNALFTNTTAEYNTSVGHDALYDNTTGSYNTATGSQALSNNTIGLGNTATGYNALFDNTTGSFCVAIGYNANNSYSGSYNTIVGAYADLSADLTNSVAIGYNTTVDASNKIRLGSTSITSIGGQVSWTSFSDERVKNDIKDNVPGLKFIRALRPVTYHYSIKKENELLGIENDTNQWPEKYDLEKINFTGLLAQEVDAAARKINYDFSGIDKTGKIWGLRYSEFVVPLIKAVQELSAENSELKDKNETLESSFADMFLQLKEIKKQLAELQQTLQQCCPGATTAALSDNDAKLSNNLNASVYPNPAKNIATLQLGNAKNADITITDDNGKTVWQQRKVNSAQIQIATQQFATGMYYIRITSGKQTASLKLIKQ